MISSTRSTTSIDEALIDAASWQRATQNSANVERNKSTRIDEPGNAVRLMFQTEELAMITKKKTSVVMSYLKIHTRK